jgi:ligand-binding sensor domain-containing protein
MTARKILLWGLPVLVCGFIFANIYIENSYQSGRQAGWITYLENAKNRSTMISSSCYGKGNIFVDGQGGIWIIGAGTCDTYHDIYHFDGEIWTNMGSAKNIQLALDKQGQIWRLTEQDIDRQSHTSTLEIAVFKEGNWVTYSTVSSKNLHKDIISINTFAIDARGSVWVGYHWQSDGGMKGPGVSVFDGLNWISYTRYNSGLTGDGRVTVIAFDQQDQAWIATEPGGVNVFDGQKWIYYVVGPNDQRTKFNINVIAFDDGGDAWLGNENGEVIVYDGEQWAIYAPGQCMNFPCYQDIAFDNHGTAWVASSKAVSTFDGETWTFLTPENSGLAGNAINAVAVDGEGRIWIGTNHGISVHT